MANEHLYWDQATVLAQLGILDGSTRGLSRARAHFQADLIIRWRSHE
jgi:hypothetical protein